MNTELRSFRPGAWFGIFGAHATVLLPPTEKRRVAELWSLVDDGAEFGEVLDALIATGLRDLPGFVLISDHDGTTKVVLRGAARATFTADGEQVDLDGSSASTWVERSLTAVEAMTITLDQPEDPEHAVASEHDDTDFTLAGGLVRVGSVQTPPATPESQADEPVDEPVAAAPAEEPSADQPLAEEPTEAPTDESDDEPVAEPQAGAKDESQDESRDESFDAPDAPAAAADPFAKTEEPAVAADSSGGYDEASSPATEPFDVLAADEQEAEQAPAPDRFGDTAPPQEPTWGKPEQTVQPEPSGRSGQPAPEPAWGQPAREPAWGQQQGWGQPVPEAAVAAPPAAPGGQAPWGAPVPAVGQAEEPYEDHDGMTRAGAYDPNQFARPEHGIPGQPQAPSVTARPVARLSFSSGETVDVDRAILIGRAPEARRFSSTDQPRLVTVPSPNQEISSTHVEIRPGSGVDHGTAIVTDMGSTNGTVLVQPGLAPEDLQPGIPVQLIPGAIVDLGDGVTISVSNP